MIMWEPDTCTCVLEFDAWPPTKCTVRRTHPEHDNIDPIQVWKNAYRDNLDSPAKKFIDEKTGIEFTSIQRKTYTDAIKVLYKL